MCGRYALGLFPSEVVRRLRDSHMPVDYWPDDGDTRPPYNFAPGHTGLVYRTHVSEDDTGARERSKTSKAREANEADSAIDGNTNKGFKGPHIREENSSSPKKTTPQYKLQSMKWGLVPSGTEEPPDYTTLMKTMNCRDDTLARSDDYEPHSGRMWTIILKHKNRCIIVAQGFYEWLKGKNRKDKRPYFVKRKDGQLMCFAGLWDCVQFKGSTEKVYTYTIITTHSNSQLYFLHDRMPVILENGSKGMFQWLNCATTKWDEELQELLNPFDGELEYYPVKQEVGSIKNDSHTFIIPVSSPEHKGNIVNFLNTTPKKGTENWLADTLASGTDMRHIDGGTPTVKEEEGEERAAYDVPEPPSPSPMRPIKRGADSLADPGTNLSSERAAKAPKTSQTSKAPTTASQTKSAIGPSPQRPPSPKNYSSSKKAGSPVKNDEPGCKKITSFFSKR